MITGAIIFCVGGIFGAALIVVGAAIGASGKSDNNEF